MSTPSLDLASSIDAIGGLAGMPSGVLAFGASVVVAALTATVAMKLF